MHNHDHHDHDHDHDHDHTPITETDEPLTEARVLEQALRELLDEKGVITAAQIARQIDIQDSKTPALGAKVVAKAWTDPQFKQRLLKDPLKAINEDFGLQISTPLELVVLENTADVHNVVVCTLCSCYPRMLLGIPPAWYKSTDYRSRVVVEPRAVLKEFGVELSEQMQVRVSDSTADIRYLVLPMRPPGTENMTLDELEALVTRDTMIGTAVPVLE
ncbi:MAG: nitrile hydratase subunit alpha [Burkholderiaceae bacterium]|nr:nitrile hydratase subunit alpha [Burkholderiaceae bacterium]MCD8538051.1 nitrile hydratase subunit alpha [Burkholderiaceae bacterium]MCD8565408.1 nitrile hydratase subunit alpha [Burkholderiaceae bacterium]